MKKLITLSALLAIAGCAAAPPAVLPVVTKMPQVSYQKPQPVVMRPTTWSVYTKNNIQKLQADLEANGGTIIALTPQGYKNLATNLLELQRYIDEQKAVTIYLVREINQRSESIAAKATAKQ